ncbi:ABC transporter ATP-binding protein [Amphibacillus xylanus]|uniref:Putative ABC transporter permease/ATP-binding protein n=1 Tax=Amphibacillus xylanus (strain ATCC 51415 / DSM 6626 / JCM 7361 / LMG 17667 / NBRC 15112 / Ep01) TaxID=698758 RepID=K0J4D8_AMPXN|nr:ABC transporter ATP-binding protein [Amphibacillus xylanus]BAM48102.1 putative ABC transporter permease/ATP-binding protein [Amphibacillus xylanus NBRC 15112]
MAKHRRFDQTEKVSVESTWMTMKRIWSYLSSAKWLIGFVLLLVLTSTILSLVAPYLLGYAIDHYLLQIDPPGLIRLIILLAVVYLTTAFANWFQHFLMVGVAQKAIYRIREQLFNKLHKLPIQFFDNSQQGDIMSRITNDLETVSEMLNNSVIQLFASVLSLIGTLVFMLYLSPLLTLVTLTIVPMLYFGMKWITNRTRQFFKQQQEDLGEINGYIEEIISGQSVVKIFSQEEKAIADFEVKNRQLRDSGYYAQAYSGFIPKLMNGLNNISFALIAFIGGVLAINQIVSIGVIVTFTQYSRQFTRPLRNLANQFNSLLSAIAGAVRVFEILDLPNEEETEDGEVWSEIKGAIRFDRVTFSYDNDETLNDVSLSANPGETIALVGPTGAGKTTIINLLSRFYDPDAGTITIDGYDITKTTRQTLRENIGFVLQDPYLFNGTIKDNIRYGRLDATDEEIIEAAKLANADSFIIKLPNGYDTKLSQEGGGISQGQKQLISIARALLADPKILILDEATSSIDTVTEIKIQDALNTLMKGRTSIVIAHRLNTIQNADRIFVMKDGKIIEDGTHNSLLKLKGFYHELYNGYFQENAS